MTKLLRLGFLLLILESMIIGCTFPATPTGAPVATAVVLPAATSVPEKLPFEGMWMTDGDEPEIIVFTRDSMYQVQSDQPTDMVAREHLSKIVSYDLAANHISLHTQMIRVNGKKFGYDSPNFTITYLIEGDTLRIGIGGEDQFVTETEPTIYYRK